MENKETLCIYITGLERGSRCYISRRGETFVVYIENGQVLGLWAQNTIQRLSLVLIKIIGGEMDGVSVRIL